MHEEILTNEQKHLIPLVESFSEDFFLVGGTAIALQIGHRRSIDFDMFTHEPFDNGKIRRKISRATKTFSVLRDETGQYTLNIRGVQFTFFHYPYVVPCGKRWGSVKMPDLLTLAAMKVFALARRAKWKDYVDLYFIFSKHHSVGEVVDQAKKLFGNEFNEKMIRAQLAYFEDINYSEKVNYLPGFETPDETVKKALIEFSLQ